PGIVIAQGRQVEITETAGDGLREQAGIGEQRPRGLSCNARTGKTVRRIGLIARQENVRCQSPSRCAVALSCTPMCW
ncbi:MAG: hypothetical protein ACT4NY_32005, partial [Pseudonocardiales bacterium]